MMCAFLSWGCVLVVDEAGVAACRSCGQRGIVYDENKYSRDEKVNVRSRLEGNMILYV